MSSVYCKICGEMICKYEMDFRACGGLTVDIGQDKELKLIDICTDCAKAIAKTVVGGY